MPMLKRKSDFFTTDEGVEIEAELRKMAADQSYKTESSYSVNSTDNQITFVDRHKNYLMQHQNLDPRHYLSNLKLMTKIR
jgi:hypothetical protein